MDKHAKRSSLLHYPVLIVFTLFFVGPVSYTHLDVYKRQVQRCFIVHRLLFSTF